MGSFASGDPMGRWEVQAADVSMTRFQIGALPLMGLEQLVRRKRLALRSHGKSLGCRAKMIRIGCKTPRFRLRNPAQSLTLVYPRWIGKSDERLGRIGQLVTLVKP